MAGTNGSTFGTGKKQSSEDLHHQQQEEDELYEDLVSPVLREDSQQLSTQRGHPRKLLSRSQPASFKEEEETQEIYISACLPVLDTYGSTVDLMTGTPVIERGRVE